MKILLIDDCVDIGFLVNVSLNPHDVRQVYSVDEATAMLSHENFDLLLIDVSLPDGDGFRLCRDISGHPRWESIPKILLTGRSDISDKVFGFSCGADDYITKPFAHQELRARVEARLKSKGGPSGPVRFDDFEFDGDFQKCSLVGEDGKTDLQLTPTEYRLFMVLLKRLGQPVSREELVSELWKAHGTNIEIRGIDSHIAHLRKKLGPRSSRLVSVYGRGYVFVPAEEAEDPERKQAA